MTTARCSNCGGEVSRPYQGRCRPCYDYRYRNARERPEVVIIANETRRFVNEIEMRRKRANRCGDRVFLADAAWVECERTPRHDGLPHKGPIGEWVWDGPSLVRLG